jgi:hypothetical protein
MSDDKKVEPSKEKESINPLNWILGSEFILAIVILALLAAGYIVLK